MVNISVGIQIVNWIAETNFCDIYLTFMIGMQVVRYPVEPPQMSSEMNLAETKQSAMADKAE